MSRNIVAILRGITPDEAVACTQMLINCGIDKIEVPLNSPQPYDSIELMVREFRNDAMIGAGTVLNADAVQRLSDIGAALIVSPDCNVDVIKATKQAGMLSFPGVMTPTECFCALRNGADGLKIFPGNLVQPEGLKALRAVLPQETNVLAVGGAGPENFAAWKAAGANGFGIGSALYQAGMPLAELQNRANKIIASYDEVYGI